MVFKFKSIIAFILILFIPYIAQAACVADGANWASTPDLASVQSCHDQADEGDTITVSAGDGTETWTAQLAITKKVQIIGPGAANLTITANFTPTCTSFGSACALIYYNYTGTSANLFRLSGFTLDGGSKVVELFMNSAAYGDTTNRIDNNTFQHANNFDIRVVNSFGVIDNNKFYPVKYFMSIMGLNANWNTASHAHGSINDMYLEDNTIYDIPYTMANDNGVGGRFTARYNTLSYLSPGGQTGGFDMHGNQAEGSSNEGLMGATIYGNQFTDGSPVHNYQFFIANQRSGKLLAHYNESTSFKAMTGAGSIRLREESDDEHAVYPTATVDGQTQHISNTYLWNNRLNNSTINPAVMYDQVRGDCTTGTLNTLYQTTDAGTWGAYCIDENTAYWQQRTGTFTGTGVAAQGGGVGCGTLANRPGTCTTGVGYWATAQSCANTTNMVGVSPTTPISGTLYKCTATNTWTAYYQPYTYPHPLRSESDTTAPTCAWAVDTTGLIATGTCSETVDAVTKTGLHFDGSVTGAVTATYKDGMPGSIVRWDLGSEVQQGETVTYTYATPGTGIKDLAANAFADGTAAVTNNSTQTAPPLYALTIGAHVGATVNVYPGINCGSTCGPVDYMNGSVLTVSVTANRNYQSCVIGGTAGCGSSTTMDGAKTCTVTCQKTSPDVAIGSGAAITFTGATATIY